MSDCPHHHSPSKPITVFHPFPSSSLPAPARSLLPTFTARSPIRPIFPGVNPRRVLRIHEPPHIGPATNVKSVCAFEGPYEGLISVSTKHEDKDAAQPVSQTQTEGKEVDVWKAGETTGTYLDGERLIAHGANVGLQDELGRSDRRYMDIMPEQAENKWTCWHSPLPVLLYQVDLGYNLD